MREKNVIADPLSHRHQITCSEWTHNYHEWPITIYLFATSLNHQLASYYSPVQDLLDLGVDVMLQNWNHQHHHAFPPFAMKLSVVNKLRSSVETHYFNRSKMCPEKVISKSSEPVNRLSDCPSTLGVPTQTIPFPSSTSKSNHASASS